MLALSPYWYPPLIVLGLNFGIVLTLLIRNNRWHRRLRQRINDYEYGG